MSDLVVAAALPNPLGKDRLQGRAPTVEQLNSEWVEFKNATSRTLLLDGVSITHVTFNGLCESTGEDIVTTFVGQLLPAAAIRLHTGPGTGWDEGTLRHLYAGRSNFVWNNRCGDCARLRADRGGLIDEARYDPEPPEGVVLTRIIGTNVLAVSTLAGAPLLRRR